MTDFRETFINTGDSDIRVGPWWDWAIRLVMVEAVVLLVWFLWQAQGATLRETWTLFSPYNIGTVIIQGVAALLVLRALNRWFVGLTLGGPGPAREAPAGGDD